MKLCDWPKIFSSSHFATAAFLLCLGTGKLLGATAPAVPAAAPADSAQIRNYTGAPGVQTRLRKMNSVLVDDPKRLERRTREAANIFDVQLEHFELKNEPAKSEKSNSRDFFSSLRVETTLRGDFQSCLGHLNRMALFATAERPERLEIDALPVRECRGSSCVRLRSVISYFRVADARFYEDREGKAASAADRLRGREEEEAKIERMRLETDRLNHQVQENGRLSDLLESLVDSLAPLGGANPLVLTHLNWSRDGGLEISGRAQDARELSAFVERLGKRGFQKKSLEGEFHLAFEPETKKTSWSMAKPYIPLGRRDPFFARMSERLGVANMPEALQSVRLEEIDLVESETGLFGFHRRARIRLPSEETLEVSEGQALGCYQGKVVRIGKNEIEVEERYVDPSRQVTKKRSVLRVGSGIHRKGIDS